MRRPLVILAGFVLVLAALLVLVIGKEWVLARGTLLLLELAPVDPRSLMQGDYMRLDYAINRDARAAEDSSVEDGRLVLTRDERGVGHFVRRETSEPLAPGEFWLRYKVRHGRVQLGAESFFFQEGQASLYARAKYGELRVTADGSSVLVGLRDEQLRPCGESNPCAWTSPEPLFPPDFPEPDASTPDLDAPDAGGLSGGTEPDGSTPDAGELPGGAEHEDPVQP